MNVPPLQAILEHFGVFVAAITGVLAGRGKQVDLFGVIVLALVTAFGGGTVRDLLVGDLPVVWIRDPALMMTAVVAALLTFFVAYIRRMPSRALVIADALALALFTVIGTQKGMTMSFTAPVCVLLGVVTGVTGGIVRDVLTGEVPMVFRPHIFLYATASLCGSLAMVLAHFTGLGPLTAAWVGALLVLGLRLAGIYWKLTLPVYEG